MLSPSDRTNGPRGQLAGARPVCDAWCRTGSGLPLGGLKLHGGVAAPPGAGGNFGALHQERVGLEPHTLADLHAVMDERAHPERGACSEGAAVGLERAVFLGVALDDGARIERAAVADGDEAALGERAAV